MFVPREEWELRLTSGMKAVDLGACPGGWTYQLVRREMSYSDAAVLGKEREEALLWADMRRDAAEQLVRRLSYLPAVTPAKPANASTQP